MRQTLLRIRFDELWSTEPIDGITALGIGWLLIPWLAYGVWWFVRRRNAARSGAVEDGGWWGPLAVCGAGCAAILTAPEWTSGFASRSVPVYGYGFMLFAGFLAGAWTAVRRARSIGLPPETVWDVATWLFLSGIAGARLFYLVQYRERVFAGKSGTELLRAAVNLPDGGLVLYGGILLAVAVYFAFCKLRGISPWRLGDVLVPSLFLGVAFGRIGCLLNGCCFGDACDLAWGIRFPQGSVPFSSLVMQGLQDPAALRSLPLHPTQIYSAIDGLVLMFLTDRVFRHGFGDGATLAAGWVGYPITRFLIEMLRGDESGQFRTSLTISQWISLLLLGTGLIYAGCLVWRGRNRRGSGVGLLGGASSVSTGPARG